MTKKTIQELDDGTAVISSAAIVAFDQPDQTETQKTSIRPNPTNQINVTSQAKLETELGVDLEIPDGEKITIVVDESFALTKPFKIGLGSVLEIYGSTAEVEIDTTGITSELFQHINPANDTRALLVHDIFLKGDNTQPLCFLKGTSRIFMENCRVEGFVGAETEFPFASFAGFSPVDWEQGWINKNPNIIQMELSNLRQTTAKGITFFSIITNISSKIVISDNAESTLFSGDSQFYLDKNAPIDSSIILNNTSISAGDFYQQGKSIAVTSVIVDGDEAVFNTATPHHLTVGERIRHEGFNSNKYNGSFIVTDIGVSDYEIGVLFDGDHSGTLLNRPVTIDSVADNGSGKTRFTTALPHGLRVGKVMRVKTGLYDQTAIVTAVDTPETGMTFDADITFAGTDTGFMDAASLNSEDIQVLAINNPGQRDSMFTGEAGLEIFGNEFATASLPQNGVADIFLADAWRYKNLERINKTINPNSGALQIKDKATRFYDVRYSATIEKQGGSAGDIGIFIAKNGNFSIGFNTPHTVNSGKVQISHSELI